MFFFSFCFFRFLNFAHVVNDPNDVSVGDSDKGLSFISNRVCFVADDCFVDFHVFDCVDFFVVVAGEDFCVVLFGNLESFDFVFLFVFVVFFSFDVVWFIFFEAGLGVVNR